MICAIIVTYNPDISQFIKYYNNNMEEVDYTIIVDNSDKTSIQNELSKLNTKKNTELIQLFENKGIAYAQNIGIKKVQACDKYDFILFLDQDSMLNSGTVIKYIKYYNELKKNNKIACIGVGNSENKKINNTEITEVNQIISSGSFCPVGVFKKIGLMDESLFIDFVEYDWCWRAKSKEFKIFSIGEISLIHKDGIGKIYIFGSRMILPSPTRHYYQYRNFLYLMHKNYVPLYWKFRMLFKMIIKIPIYIIIMDSKYIRLKFIFRGVYDYITNKKGKYI
jgi:rhamnosyltransferase